MPSYRRTAHLLPMDKPAFYCPRVAEAGPLRRLQDDAYRCSSEIPMYGAAWATSGGSASDMNFA
jgi:hypothetical protein